MKDKTAANILSYVVVGWFGVLIGFVYAFYMNADQNRRAFEHGRSAGVIEVSRKLAQNHVWGELTMNGDHLTVSNCLFLRLCTNRDDMLHTTGSNLTIANCYFFEDCWHDVDGYATLTNVQLHDVKRQ